MPVIKTSTSATKLFVTLLVIHLIINLTEQTVIDNELKDDRTPLCVQKVANSLCDVSISDTYRSLHQTIDYSLNCEDVENDNQLLIIIDLINKNKTFCGRKYSNSILKHLSITRSDSSAVFKSLEWLDKSLESLTISKSFARDIPNHLFQSFNDLKYLNISENNLTKFNSNDLFSATNRLVSLDLSHNHLTSIDLTRLKSLDVLLIHNNSLETITQFSHNIRTISLANNTWKCDEQINWLLKYTNNRSIQVLNREKTRCESPEAAKCMSFTQWWSVLKTPICGQCECWPSRNKDSMTVNCSDKGLTVLPSSLPLVTKIVRLDNNKLKNISLNSKSLNHWRNVSYLHLNNNTIESFVGLERTNLLKSLVALHITHNRLREIPVYILDQLSHLDELYLSENPWICNCRTVVFQTWLQHHFKSVKDVYNIRCGDDADNRFSNRFLLRIPKSELCPQPNEPINIFEAINWILASLIIVIIVKLIYDYFWQRRTGKLPQFFRFNV